MIKHEKSPEQEEALVKPAVSPIPTSPKKTPHKPFKLLIFLIILVVILDATAIFMYYKPNLLHASNSQTEIKEGQCEDSTPYNECSKNKPYFCYNGELLEKAFTCGCPPGYRINFQNCKKV